MPSAKDLRKDVRKLRKRARKTTGDLNSGNPKRIRTVPGQIRSIRTDLDRIQRRFARRYEKPAI